MRYHLLFEQSGTFKNVLKKFGHEAFDYDIENTFGETDYVVDLFDNIEREYATITSPDTQFGVTVFTNLKPEEDFIIAFFPCTHFCDANSLIYRRLSGEGKKGAGVRAPFTQGKLEELMKRNHERGRYFELYMKFCFICQEKGIPTIIENPASGMGANFLKRYSPIDVGYYERDRYRWGDDFRKPTNFYCINFEMKEKKVQFGGNWKAPKSVYNNASGMLERSLISEIYVENFYKRFLEGGDEKCQIVKSQRKIF